MKIVIAPDSFKGSLRAREVGAALAEGWQTCRPQDEMCILPLADGGEGSCEAVAESTGGRYLSFPVHDPLMRPVSGRCGCDREGTNAVIELAAASGLELLKPGELAPLSATTYGSGEMLKSLLDQGFRKILFCVGGSATVDGGAGMLQALGVRFFDETGAELPPGIGGGALSCIRKIDISLLDPRLAGCEITVGCDVTNPLTGSQGAAAVFAPQKGATPAEVALLEQSLVHWAELWQDPGITPGDGAAGGAGFALRRVLGAKNVSGARAICELCRLPQQLQDAALLITGEGCSDAQTLNGKLCAVAAGYAKSAGVPAVLCSGALKGGLAPLEQLFDGCFSIAQGPGTLEKAMAETAENLKKTGRALAAFFSAALLNRGK